MTLLVLMYHRAQAGPHGNPAELLDAHFAHVAATYPNVLPGEALTPDTLNVCLTFDDAYFDFYTTVFPLLKKHGLRALLAVPTSVIRDRVDASRAERLGIEAETAFGNPSRGGFCTWDELEEMSASGRVRMAAHGFTHTRLDTDQARLDTEIDAPQAILRARFADSADSFVFPYGRYSERSLRQAQSRYRYLFRIGGAVNDGWDRRLLYRVDADRMESPWSLFSPARMMRYRARNVWNRLRRR